MALILNNFNPLAPRGARLSVPGSSVTGTKFQSTRPSRGETGRGAGRRRRECISIHSPLAGRDKGRDSGATEGINFNPLAPRGARRYRTGCGFTWIRFQSTRPSRGETTYWLAYGRIILFQSTRPSRGETCCDSYRSAYHRISIHSPLAGRDRRA